MMLLDEVVPNYRRARDRWPNAPTLAKHYQTVVEAYEGTGQALIEAVKSFLECVCRTIIVDYGGNADSDASSTELLVAALDGLGIRNTRGASKFDRVLPAHNKLADALSDCRNQDGAVAHGKDGFLDALCDDHVRLYLLTVDTILSLVLGALDGSQPDLAHTREPYDQFKHINDVLDEVVGVEASVDSETGLVVLKFTTRGLPDGVKLNAQPSRLLFELDRLAYIEIRKSLPETIRLEQEYNPEHAASGAADLYVAGTSAGAAAGLVSSYTGRLSGLRPALEAELITLGAFVEGSLPSRVAPSILRAFDRIAGLDWTQRPPMRARLLVAFKHILRASNARTPDPNSIAEKLVEWFASRVGGAEQVASNPGVREEP